MFITNTLEKNLEKRIKELLQKSSELKFLVGFFYFSGLNIFYETLKELYQQGKLSQEFLKILVGLNVDIGIYGLYEGAKNPKIFDPLNLKQDLFNSIKKAFTSDELDNQLIYEQISFFKELFLKKIIVIRKTIKPNHAKLYIFKMDENSRVILPGFFITGSSNLTKAGIKEQDEFNVEIKDYGFQEAEEYFDKLWQKAIELNEQDVQRVIQIFDNETFFRRITPFEAYVYLLKTYLEIHKGNYPVQELRNLLEKRGYVPYDYQLSAVSQAVSICQAHKGCILADVTGLGKTITACLIAKAIGKRGVIICPPYLVGDDSKSTGWKKYLEDFELFDYQVWSVGKLEEALSFVRDRPEIEVVIVDEAHRFRNQRTQSYHYLKEICRGKIVILLSATPFNNSPSDIFSLLKLFTIPKKSTIVFDEDIESRFDYYQSLFKKLAYIKKYWNSLEKKRKKRALAYYNEIFLTKKSQLNIDDIKYVKLEVKKLAKEIRNILEPVVIRRNRLDLKYFKDKENIELPEVKDPKEVFFELTEEQSNFYDEVIKSFYSSEEGGKFKGAIYLPALYEKGIIKNTIEEEQLISQYEDHFLFLYQRNLYDLMRRLLVKRFESSFSAFYQSLKNFKELYEIAYKFVKTTKKFILSREYMEKILEEYENDEDSILQELNKYKEIFKEKDPKFYKIYEVDKFVFNKEFLEDIESDIKLFQEFIEKVENLKLLENDPKAQKLIEEINEILKQKRKVVIFTEYIDTANYLRGILEKVFPMKLLSAIGNISKETIRKIYTNFDAQYKEQEDIYDILLTTDKLSEGFNLNRAGVVINYDIPWNPVRVIQRVGRINRIGKKVYDEIYIINFFPTEKGANYVKSKEIAQTKMFMIHNVLGEDSKIFSPDEEPQASELYKRLTNLPKEDEEESFYTKVKKEFDKLNQEYPHIFENISDFPSRIKLAKLGNQDELMVFIKKGKDLFVGYYNYTEKVPMHSNFEEVFEKIKALPNDISVSLSERFWEAYRQLLEKSSFQNPKYFRTFGSKDIYEASVRTLKHILTSISSIKGNQLEFYRTFILDLIEDIQNYRTLSEYIISEISKFESLIKSHEQGNQKNITIIFRKLEQIKNQIGQEFLSKIQNYSKQDPENVIIAIENRKNI